MATVAERMMDRAENPAWSHRSGAWLCAVFVTAGLTLLQALLGGSGLLFVFPGLALIGTAALIGVVMAARSRAQADLSCLGAAGIFCGYILLRALASPDYFARPDLVSMMGALLVYGLTATVLTSSSVRSAIIAALLGFALVHVLVGFIQFNRGDNFMPISFLQRPDYGQRASGLYVCPNHLAGLLEVLGVFGMSFVCWSRWPVWSKLLIAYATAVCYVGLALTGSRGGYLSAIASIVVFAGLSLVVLRAGQRRGWWRYAAAGLAGLALLLATGSLLIRHSGFLSERAGNIIDTKNMRVELWRAALQQWRLQPIVGTGSGTYRFYGRQFRVQDMQNDPIDVHNDYLHLLCEYGLVGAGGFLLFFAAHMRQGYRNIRHTIRSVASDGRTLLSNRLAINLAALAAIAAYVVHSIFDFNLHIPANAALMAFVFGLVANSGSTRRASAPLLQLVAPKLIIAFWGMVLLTLCARFFPGEYYVERARVALRDENPAASILFAKKSIDFERRNPETFFYLGRALIARANQSDQQADRANSYQPAVEAYEEARRLAPLDGTYPLNLAFTYDEMRRFTEAESMYAVARARDPHSLSLAQLYRAHRASWQRLNGEAQSSL